MEEKMFLNQNTLSQSITIFLVKKIILDKVGCGLL